MDNGYQSNINNVLSALTHAQLQTLTAIGLYVEGEAKLRCAVDTGNLRSSLDHKVDESAKAVHIGTNIEYAIYVEKGTSKQPEQPYLTPAAEDNINNIKRLAERYVGGGMK
jgi:HK97 gp10 family phage protein